MGCSACMNERLRSRVSYLSRLRLQVPSPRTAPSVNRLTESMASVDIFDGRRVQPGDVSEIMSTIAGFAEPEGPATAVAVAVDPHQLDHSAGPAMQSERTMPRVFRNLPCSCTLEAPSRNFTIFQNPDPDPDARRCSRGGGCCQRGKQCSKPNTQGSGACW